MKHIGVIGSGAVASLYSMMLQRAGFKISMVCRSGFDEIRQKGIFINSTWGDSQFVPDNVLSNAKELPVDIDLLIIATKVYPDLDLIDLLGPFSKGICPILLIQNGMFIETPYEKLMPDLDLFTGLAFVCVFRKSYTHINHIDYGRLDIGVYPSGSSKLLQEIGDKLQIVGLDCRVSLTIQRQRWEKLVWNAAFNPLSVVTQKTTSEMLQDPKLKDRIASIMTEVCRCADLDHCSLDSNIVNLKIDQTSKMAPYKTSMLLDYEAGRRLEYDAILSNLIQFSETVACDIPHVKQLYFDLIDFIKTTKKECL